MEFLDPSVLLRCMTICFYNIQQESIAVTCLEQVLCVVSVEQKVRVLEVWKALSTPSGKKPKQQKGVCLELPSSGLLLPLSLYLPNLG